MSKFKIGFIGSGKMATAIAAGIVNQKVYSSNQIIASDISEESLKHFKEKCGAETCTDNQRVISESDIVVFAVKPQMFELVGADLDIPKDKHIISIAAGLKISSIVKSLKSKKITRVMPNTPLMVGMGASAYCSSSEVSESDKKAVEDIFGCAGIIKAVEEKDIDAVTGVSGSGPAYVFEFIESLALAGEKNGLNYETSLDLAVHTVAGAAEMVAKKMGTPDELRNAVTSPNGTTYAALQDLKANNFRDLISSAVDAAVARSLELGKEK
ncbi:MAG: pyrroline-5-carboxylate reductase [Lentisphaeraceae bacterium]|nr:pyrroline-5-carboxylate reductase [Lentisphaeraceae bacterium]